MTRSDLEHFVEAHYPAVVRCVTLAIGSEGAEDAVQEAFARLFARWSRVSRYDRPDLWVRTVALRLARRTRARRARDVPLTDVSHIQEPRLPDASLRAAVASLPRAQRVAIVLHYYEDLPIELVAQVMECAPSTARVHLHRGRRRLAELMSLEVDHVG